MQCTNIIELKPNKKQEKILKECLLLSSCIYNSANYIVRQQFFKKERLSNYIDLRVKLQNTNDYRLLGRSYASPRIRIYDETILSVFGLIKSKTQKWVNLPKYLKNRKTNTTIPSFLSIDAGQYSIISKTKVRIPLSFQMRKKYNMKDFKIRYNSELKYKGQQCRGKIVYKNKKYYLHQSIYIDTPSIKVSNVVAGLDIGIKNLITVSTNTDQELIIGSKRFFKQWKHLTDNISKEQHKLSLIKMRTSNNFSKLYYKRTLYQDNLFNNITAKLFRFLNRNNVSKLIIGDLKHILDNTHKGKKCNQMMHNYWSFGKLLTKIKNKAEEHGIEVVMTTEEYTTRTCPICYDNSKENVKDRIFLCNYCGYINHRDIVGAKNILLKGMHDLNKSVHWYDVVPHLEVENSKENNHKGD